MLLPLCYEHTNEPNRLPTAAAVLEYWNGGSIDRRRPSVVPPPPRAVELLLTLLSLTAATAPHFCRLHSMLALSAG